MQMGEKAVISDERHLKKVTTAILNLPLFSIVVTWFISSSN